MTTKQQKLFDDNLKLVLLIYNKYYKCFSSMYDDLIQVGTIGLWKSCLQFNEEKGFKFSSYACRCIRTEMYKVIREELKWGNNTVTETKMSKEEKSNFFDVIGDCSEEIIIDNIYAEQIISKCKNKDVMAKIASGNSMSDIARQLNFSRQRIHQIASNQKKYVREFIDNARDK